MKTEFDAAEGMQVKRGIDREDYAPLMLSAAFTVCAGLSIFLWLCESPSNVLFIFFLLAPLLIWLSVFTLYRKARDVLLFAIPLAVLMSLFWAYALFFGHHRGV